MADLSVSIMDSGKQLASLREEEIKLRSVGVMDNPLQWFVNQLKLDDVAGKYNAEVGKNATAMQQMQQLTLTADNRVQLAQKAAATTSIAEETAAAKKEQAAGAARLAMLNQEAAKVGLTTMTVRAALNQKELEHAKEQFSLQMRIQEFALAQTNSARAERALQLQEEARQDIRDEKAEKKEARVRIVERVNNFMGMVGGTPFASFEAFATLSPKKQAELMELSYTPNIVNGQYGTTAVGAVEFMQKYNLPRIESMGPAMRYVERMQDLAIDKMGAGNLAANQLAWKKLDEAGRDHFLRLANTQVQLEYQKKIVPGDNANPYNPGLALSVVQIPALAANPVIQAYSTVPAANPNADFSGRQLFESAKSLVKAGKLSAEEAAKAGSDALKLINQDVAEERDFKILAVPFMKTFNVEIQQNAAVYGTNTVTRDLANPSVFLNALVRSDAQISRHVNTLNQYNAGENRAGVLITPDRNMRNPRVKSLPPKQNLEPEIP